jgi:hypothetical protein
MIELHAELGAAVLPAETDDAAHRLDLVVRPHADVVRADAPFGLDRGRFG